MLVHVGVPLALLRTLRADLHADLEHRSDQIFIRACSPRSDCCRGPANVGTIKVEPNALDQLLYMLRFAQAGIGADRAHLSAIEAFFDAPDQTVVCVALDAWVRADDLARVHCFLNGLSVSKHNPRVGLRFREPQRQRRCAYGPAESA